jgi:hypothetical protein
LNYSTLQTSSQECVEAFNYKTEQNPHEYPMEHSPVTERLHRSKQDIRLWASSFKAESDSLGNHRSEYCRLLREFRLCIHNLEKENQQLFLQQEDMRQAFTRSRERFIRPKTLRGIISLRIMEITETSIDDTGVQNTPIVESESLHAIPASILDVALFPNQLDIVEELLPEISSQRVDQFTMDCAFVLVLSVVRRNSR